MEEKPSSGVNTSRNRMNLVAIKKVDPYAKEIVDSSAHVAFYTFNSQKNEWEKTDVEGAFFIYRRNAEPFHSIFINNRLNTTSFVEPITCKLEIQSQPPFLLYRNERARIRGFWFYNSQECNRISEYINIIANESDAILTQISTSGNTNNSNIFNMLSKAQSEYTKNMENRSIASYNVLNFFAAAKPTSFGFPQQRMLSNSLSVEQLEKQQRAKTPSENRVHRIFPKSKTEAEDGFTLIERETCEYFAQDTSLDNLLKSVNFKISCPSSEICELALSNQSKVGIHIKDLLYKNFVDKNTENLLISDLSLKPALMPPTMFEAGELSDFEEKTKPIVDPLNYTQFVDAFTYLVKNDVNFMKKLYEAYLTTFSNLRT